MNWPWQRSEDRQDNATQLAILQIEAQQRGVMASPERIAACRACASLYDSAFSAATIAGAPVPVGAEWLPLAVRAMLFAGESLNVLDLRRGRFELLPVSGWDVTGGPDPASWRYRCDLPGPSAVTIRTVGRDGVVWLPWETSTIEPWRGRGPWHDSDSFRALATIEGAAEAEGRAPAARVASIPKSMPEPVRAGVRNALARSRGAAVLLDSPKDHGSQETMTRFERLGFDAPQSLPMLRRQLEEAVAAAAGVPGEMLYVSPGGGSGARESFRRWYHVQVLPLARRIEAELSRAFESDVTISLPDLGAADVTGRARAFNSLMQGGMDAAKASEIAGL